MHSAISETMDYFNWQSLAIVYSTSNTYQSSAESIKSLMPAMNVELIVLEDTFVHQAITDSQIRIILILADCADAIDFLATARELDMQESFAYIVLDWGNSIKSIWSMDTLLSIDNVIALSWALPSDSIEVSTDLPPTFDIDLYADLMTDLELGTYVDEFLLNYVPLDYLDSSGTAEILDREYWWSTETNSSTDYTFDYSCSSSSPLTHFDKLSATFLYDSVIAYALLLG